MKQVRWFIRSSETKIKNNFFFKSLLVGTSTCASLRLVRKANNLSVPCIIIIYNNHVFINFRVLDRYAFPLKYFQHFLMKFLTIVLGVRVDS